MNNTKLDEMAQIESIKYDEDGSLESYYAFRNGYIKGATMIKDKTTEVLSSVLQMSNSDIKPKIASLFYELESLMEKVDKNNNK